MSQRKTVIRSLTVFTAQMPFNPNTHYSCNLKKNDHIIRKMLPFHGDFGNSCSGMLKVKGKTLVFL